MKYTIFQVDAFSVKPFKGNPAAVCILPKLKDSAWMQAVAQEMNLSETAFLFPKDNDYLLRWFTPTTEVDLCGHATIASAHILFENGLYDSEETINFHTASGIISATTSNGTIELNMPLLKSKDIEIPQDAVEATGLKPISAGISETNQLVLVLDSEQEVREFEPDLRKIARLPYIDLIITAVADDAKYDFVSRFFSPQTGIPEDPVTGMAHCLLGPFWQRRLGKDMFCAYQASARGGKVWVKVADDRCFIGGKAVTVFKAELFRQD
jgi:PhzF family phenazine biosynthesis protein